MTERKTRSRLTGGIIAVIVLAVCLVVTTVALAYSIASVRDNTFATGGVRINLNDGEPVIRPDEFLFEPGMTVKLSLIHISGRTMPITALSLAPS